ncbi:GNAT family N-acetyltransferase [Kribbella swartbergensis]
MHDLRCLIKPLADAAAGTLGLLMGIDVVVPDRALLERAVRKFMGVQGAADSGGLTFVALNGPEVAGWCWGYHLIRPDGSSMLYLHQLEVDEAYRRSGIGRQLLRTFMNEGTSAGATKMFLTTGAANTAARALYDAMGGGLASQGPTVNYWFLLEPEVDRSGRLCRRGRCGRCAR